MYDHNYCLLTGATSGIGKETAKDLLFKGYYLIILSRDMNRGLKLKSELLKKHSYPDESVDIIKCDLSSLKDVRSACSEIKAKYNKITLLINNAGVFSPRRKLSRDNLELTMAVNHFSHFLLTLELLPLLENNATESRIINVSSVGHYKAQPFDLDDINFEKHFSGFMVYRLSKLANLLFTYKLADELQEKNSAITVNALHPGVVRTNIARSFPLIGWLWKINPRYISAEKGAQNTIYVATSPELAKVTGKYFSKMKERKSSDQSYNKELQEKLWNLSLNITGANLIL